MKAGMRWSWDTLPLLKISSTFAGGCSRFYPSGRSPLGAEAVQGRASSRQSTNTEKNRVLFKTEVPAALHAHSKNHTRKKSFFKITSLIKCMKEPRPFGLINKMQCKKIVCT